MKLHQGFAFTTVFTGLLATTLVPLLATAQNNEFLELRTFAISRGA